MTFDERVVTHRVECSLGAYAGSGSGFKKSEHQKHVGGTMFGYFSRIFKILCQLAAHYVKIWEMVNPRTGSSMLVSFGSQLT
jgi:hypothetical protein